MSGYIKYTHSFEVMNMNMSFLIKDVIENKLGNKFHSEPFMVKNT